MRSPARLGGRARQLPLLLFVFALAMLVVTASGWAASAAPHWVVFSQPAPTEFHPGDMSDFYEVIIANDGDKESSGTIAMTDTLPAGLLVSAVTPSPEIGCEVTSSEGAATVSCTSSASVAIGNNPLVVKINVQVPEGATGPLTNSIRVVGGGAAEARTENVTLVTPRSQPVPYGATLITDITEDGGVATQAGAHPFAFTSLLAFNVAAIETNETCGSESTPSCATVNANAKDLEIALPAGFVGNPTSVPYCTQAQFERHSFFSCPASTQVGAMYLYFYREGTHEQYAPVYNIKPPPGQPAELGFSVSTLAHIPIFFHVRGSDHGLTADVANINQFVPVRLAVLSIWGSPSDGAHDPLRLGESGGCGEGSCPGGIFSPRPFLRLPTSCSAGPLSTTVSGDSWQDQKPAPYPLLTSSNTTGMTGCEQLRFAPTVGVKASTQQAGKPVGYDVTLKVPQKEALGSLATPDVRDVELALPEGTVISPSAANGLVACSEAQFGLKDRTKGHCPSASKVGSVKITTPLLSTPISGALYVGEPECAPCSPSQTEAGQLVHLLFEVDGSGVIIKLSGHTKVNQDTGQLTTSFSDTPQLPFSELTVSLERGPNAPLVNPASCGQAITVANVTSWSSMTAHHISAPGVTIEDCSTPGFVPAFRAGRTTSSRAGAFTGFAVSLSRDDGEQTLGRVSVTTPPGLLGVLKSVEQCPEAQANAGTCSAGSLIGSGAITLGPGSSPLTITGAKVYLTGPYAGNPFGLSIVTPAQAGPFVLAGNTGSGTEVVRASIAVDPHTSALTVTSDPLPQALNGVPLGIRKVDIDISRDGFVFSPTNCDAMSVAGTMTSSTGTASKVSYPFQTTDCGILPFKPKFTVSTQGKASKKNGASLHVKVTSGVGQANIAKVKVNLPVQLPSRLSTLQKACVDRVFDANPANCPAASVVGRATAVTPLLKTPLIGPAYLVSHAGAAFPDLETVLQGEGITLILDGNTQIKKGITSSIFKAVPDAPVSTFDLVLPQGPHSVLAAFGNLCTSRLNMPTVITGQNGAVVKQTTKIVATGCPKRKKSHIAKKK